MMEAFLASVQKNIKSEGEEVKSAILPLLKLIALALPGLILAHPKVQLVPKATFKLLSKLVFALFLPCLIFTQLGPSISLENIVRWWFIPVNVIISTAIGCLLGCLVAFICRPPREFVRFTIIMTAFGNTGNIPLAVVASVCHSSDAPFGPDCYGNGIAYVSFSQWVSVILVYTLVYHMMKPPLEQYDIVDEEIEIELVPADLSKPLLAEAELPGIEEKETGLSKTPFIHRLFNSVSGISQTNFPDLEAIEEGREEGGESSSESIRCLAEPRVARKIRAVSEQTPIHHILQPPTVASFLAIVIGVIPALRHMVYGAHAPLEVITDSLGTMADAAVPSVMLILGGMLGEGPNESKLGIRTTIGIIVARLLVLPVIGIGVVYLADKWNFLIAGDRLYQFVLLLQYTTPSAILLGVIASLRGYAVKEASALLFWQHVCAVLSLSMYIIVYFKLLFSYI
ncbi:protein PIN-LIKES 2-like [Populus alba]|uniref:protein PIN-LIKES 2-like n=1 Tax=Populus alba TaxID=43335 RepID=UPI00158E91C1|nr:protein PIN-LIKES 2-like [Populus alba]XP_034923884.1 protein PIN-LIKES 2-like [Populus alba]XP_034923885.1 protein PIN-LIKES 2-like [Populus alba]XP_034923886.1 protein PIN-LIKES 2-like [Populus alba]XP_034923887.1 protein PIN-LIKES 2-like [Populus alba]XP_034923889.1 protein PIN-LIKES 2-like [Populus alba]XP_034923890.1 protein PIN-LIKES 2-like [Populus alba]XP_034923891.1 protein PIN-LIKES 2-like [Populus alba]XP_034923892.1 protein PIN-LIKES 2-like [Populus alba]XP_034923893.1 prote